MTTSMSWRGGKKSNKNWIKTAKQNGGRVSLTFLCLLFCQVFTGMKEHGDRDIQNTGFLITYGITGIEDIQQQTKLNGKHRTYKGTETKEQTR